MKRFNSFYSLNVFSLHRNTWEFPKHNHNFYELIFIEQGKGKHTLNEVTFPYKKGDVFLLAPDDAHQFQIEKKTTFTFVKFTEQIFLEKLDGSKQSKWSDKIRAVLQRHRATPGSIMHNPDDRQNAFSLLKVLKEEFVKTCTYSREAALELFGALMIIIARNMDQCKQQGYISNNREVEKVNAILSYIRLHTHDSERMNLHNMANEFAMSPNYISIYVKKHTGISIQQHIIQTKMKTAEQLLKQSHLNINEIAERLGFTDASHFNKLFKKYKSINPSAFAQ